MLRSGLPKVFRNGVIAWHIVETKLGDLAACVDVLKAGKGLYLYGDAGARKTEFAASYLAHTILKGASGRYAYVPDLFTELAEIYASDDGRSRADVIDRYGAGPVVLDDLDKAKPSRASAEILLSILDRRYRDGESWLIVTANVSIDELGGPFEAVAGAAYAQPLVRRLAELCASVPMEVR